MQILGGTRADIELQNLMHNGFGWRKSGGHHCTQPTQRLIRLNTLSRWMGLLM